MNFDFLKLPNPLEILKMASEFEDKEKYPPIMCITVPNFYACDLLAAIFSVYGYSKFVGRLQRTGFFIETVARILKDRIKGADDFEVTNHNSTDNDFTPAYLVAAYKYLSEDMVLPDFKVLCADMVVEVFAYILGALKPGIALMTNQRIYKILLPVDKQVRPSRIKSMTGFVKLSQDYGLNFDFSGIRLKDLIGVLQNFGWQNYSVKRKNVVVPTVSLEYAIKFLASVATFLNPAALIDFTQKKDTTPHSFDDCWKSLNIFMEANGLDKIPPGFSNSFKDSEILMNLIASIDYQLLTFSQVIRILRPPIWKRKITREDFTAVSISCIFALTRKASESRLVSITGRLFDIWKWSMEFDEFYKGDIESCDLSIDLNILKKKFEFWEWDTTIIPGENVFFFKWHELSKILKKKDEFKRHLPYIKILDLCFGILEARLTAQWIYDRNEGYYPEFNLLFSKLFDGNNEKASSAIVWGEGNDGKTFMCETLMELLKTLNPVKLSNINTRAVGRVQNPEFCGCRFYEEYKGNILNEFHSLTEDVSALYTHTNKKGRTKVVADLYAVVSKKYSWNETFWGAFFVKLENHVNFKNFSSWRLSFYDYMKEEDFGVSLVTTDSYFMDEYILRAKRVLKEIKKYGRIPDKLSRILDLDVFKSGKTTVNLTTVLECAEKTFAEMKQLTSRFVLIDCTSSFHQKLKGIGRIIAESLTGTVYPRFSRQFGGSKLDEKKWQILHNIESRSFVDFICQLKGVFKNFWGCLLLHPVLKFNLDRYKLQRKDRIDLENFFEDLEKDIDVLEEIDLGSQGEHDSIFYYNFFRNSCKG